jgi:histidine triad (HIT) family protein
MILLFNFDKFGMYEQSCIFCKIVRKEISTNFITENDQALAFLDAYPLAVGHTLIIPKTHYSKINEMNKACSVGMFDLLWKITEPLERSLNVNSSTIAIHNGREAGQEIPHVHIHVIPRTYGDGGGPIHSLFKKNRPHLDSNTMRQIVDKIKENMK